MGKKEQVMSKYSRRDFMKTAIAGGAAAFTTMQLSRFARGAASQPSPARTAASSSASASASAAKSRVSLTTGDNRADITFKALKPFEKEIAAAIGDKMVIIKPNNVMANSRLACTEPGSIEGILEFLKSINKVSNVVMTESGLGMSTLDGFSALGYDPLAEKYKVKFFDLDQDKFETLTCIDQYDMRAHNCRVSKMLLNPNYFIISAAKMKTHDRVVATLSLKNIVVGAPLKISRSEKSIVHGGGTWGINFNLANLAQRLQPDLAVIDGFQALEGNGPGNGTPVEHRICIAGLDWLAADRLGLEVMGIDPAKVGYLTYCAQMGMGEYNLERIEVVGEDVKKHIRQYRLSNNIEEQYTWMNPMNPQPQRRGFMY